MIEKIREGFRTVVVLVVVIGVLVAFVASFLQVKTEYGSDSLEVVYVLLVGSGLYAFYAGFGAWLGFIKQDERFPIGGLLVIAGPVSIPGYLCVRVASGNPPFSSPPRFQPTPQPVDLTPEPATEQSAQSKGGFRSRFKREKGKKQPPANPDPWDALLQQAMTPSGQAEHRESQPPSR